MKLKFTLIVLAFLLFPLLLATAQALPEPPVIPAKLPTYVGAGVTCNQLASPPCNPWVTAIYPASSPLGVYLSTTTDITPVQAFDVPTQRKYWAFQTSIRQGVHKVLLTSGKFTALMGGDAGIALSQTAPAGIGMAFTASFTATAVWQISPKWAVVIPMRAIWINGGWNVVPQLGLLYKP